MASGLGGGSLIYANVLIRKPPEWFVREDLHHGGWESWPIDYADLEPHYDVVERTLGAESYPYGRDPWDALPKTAALEEAAARLRLSFERPKLAVTFGRPGEPPGSPIPNGGGPARYTCRRCGECDIGCNFGAKNTLDHTYLAAMNPRYGTIRTRAEVRRFWPLGARGFEIRYVDHGEASGRPVDTSRLPEQRLTAEHLVLAAGTLGTTYLLLKNREHFPGIGNVLGSRFSGNGDLLGFARKCRRDGQPRPIEGSRGPVITGAVRVPDALAGGDGRGFFIQDGGYPQFVDWLIEAASVRGVARPTVRLACQWLALRLGLAQDRDLSAELAAFVGPALDSSTSLTLLGIGRDVPDGRMVLDGKWLEVDWSMRRSRRYFAAVERAMSRLAVALEGRFVRSPLSWFGRVITVHPLGGCPMGRNPSQGVVDAWGRVFNHPGLWVTDGSVMPGPVGANPSLTIAAFADRAADRLLADRRRWRYASRLGRPVASG